MPAHKKGTPGYEQQVAKLKNTIYTRYGEDFYKKIGRVGGMNGHTGGFAADHNRAVEAGRKGGSISSRLADKPSLEERRAAYEKSNK